jgi:Electron transfer DM13
MEHKAPLGSKVLAVLGALIVIPGGAFLAIASVPTGGKVAIAAGVLWWVVMSSLLGKFVLKQNPDLRTPVRATLAVAAVASIVTAYVVTRGNTVDEDIVTAAPSQTSDVGPQTSEEKAPPPRNVQILSGSFNGESGHRGEGEAKVIELAKGGRVVTFSSFDVDPGAGDLRVYLHQGKSTSDDLGKFVEIAKLKGNKGDQQYEIPSDVDLKRFNSVVIWCVPFSTRIAQAPLK